MGLSFLTPLFLAGILAVAVPVMVHLIRRHQGRRLEFPSLMFLRQFPVESVRRRQIRDWPLLLLRAGALALIVLAFARPLFQVGTTDEAVGGEGLRDVVLVLDRSWSMSRGDRWDRALEEARAALDGLDAPDRASLVVFERTAQILVQPTLEPDRILAVLDTIQPGWGGSRIGAGIQAAQGLLQASDRSRKEVLLLSDYQRRSWDGGHQERLPMGTRLVNVDVGDDDIGFLTVTDVNLEDSFLEGRQRLHPVARIVRQGAHAPTNARVVFAVDGRDVESQDVEFTSSGAVVVPFEPITLSEGELRGAVRLEPEGESPEEPYRFVYSPSRILLVLLVQGNVGMSPYLRNALSVGAGPPVRIESRQGFSPADLAGADVIVLNDVPLPTGVAADALREHVAAGAGLLIVAGPDSNPAGWEDAWDGYLPGRPAAPVERNPSRGGSLAEVDRDHPVFSAFVGPTGGTIGGPRFFRYRNLTSPPSSEAGEPDDETGSGPAIRVLARFDDGSPALAERTVGAGRVLLWTSTFDTSWTNLPVHPVFVPLAREIVGFASGRTERASDFTVGQPMDVASLLSASALKPATDRGVLIGPSGTGIELAIDEAPIEFPIPGFYEIRTESDPSSPRLVVAVNPDFGESDPARFDPDELVLAVAPQADDSNAGAAGTISEFGPVADRETQIREGERRQGAWRFLLLGAMLLLIAEVVLASRLRPLASEG